jgi:TonB family protein
MNDSTQSSSVLVISNDTDVVEAIIGGNSSGQIFHARKSVQLVLDEPELLENNSIIIFDIGTADNNVSQAIDQAIKLKQSDPTQVLMVVGDKQPLADILKSNIQPMIYRAFNKPVSPNQIFLAFKSASALHQELVERQAAGEDILVVGPSENRANVNTLAAQRKTNPAILATLGLGALLIVAWLIFGGGGSEEAATTIATPTPAIEQDSGIELNESDAISQTNALNQQAANAMLEGRYVAPAGDNALEYFDKVLLIDPYDSTAYEGKKSVALALRESYTVLVQNAEFDRALKVINALKQIEPLNLENDKLHSSLEKSITDHVKKVQATGSSEDIARTTAVLAKIETEFASSKSASDALKAEQLLIAKIDAALDADNLIPPQKGNAYSLVSDALKSNKISKSNSDPRVKALSAKLLRMAGVSLTADNLEETQKLGALVKRLNVDRQGLAALDKSLKEKLAAVAVEKAKTEETVVEVKEKIAPPPPKIIPAKIISREPPRYPGRALKNDVEGWVGLRFKIDTQGVPFAIEVESAEPLGIFDAAAIKSVKKWRFSPARNQDTGLPVESAYISTKVQFRLGK